MIDLSAVTLGSAVGPYGWGVVGLNWLLHWPGVALTAMSGIEAEFPPHDPRNSLLASRIRQSLALQQSSAVPDWPAFVAMGNDFEPIPTAWGLPLSGKPTIAMPVFEDLAVAEQNVEKLKSYPLVVAASSWNRDWLGSHGIPAQLCHQGYDPVIFHPGVRRKRDDGRFRVFSGGKAEYRKGQDIVLQAFARFAERHDDAVLVAAWGSPWPGLAASFAGTPVGSPPGSEIGMPNFRAWAQRAGIKPHQIEIMPPRPNWMMAEIYGGVDCAVFPNRAEGGTNLVAMECAACEMPVIASSTTGQADLFDCGFVTTEAYSENVDYYEAFIEAAYEDEPFDRYGMTDWAWPARLAHMVEIARDAL